MNYRGKRAIQDFVQAQSRRSYSFFRKTNQNKTKQNRTNKTNEPKEKTRHLKQEETQAKKKNEALTIRENERYVNKNAISSKMTKMYIRYCSTRRDRSKLD